MQRADFNGMDRKGNFNPVYSMDELIYGNMEFFFYYVKDFCNNIGGLTQENFEKVIILSKRENILNHIRYKFKEVER